MPKNVNKLVDERPVSAPSAIAQKTAETIGVQVQGAMADISAIEVQRGKAVGAVASRVRRLLDGDAFVQDVMAEVTSQPVSMGYAPLFEGAIDVTATIQEIEDTAPRPRLSSADFLALPVARSQSAI